MDQIKFTTSSRKHRIGRARVRFVIATAKPVEVRTNTGELAWCYVGPDDRGVVLEVIAARARDGALIVIHAMPYAFRRKK